MIHSSDATSYSAIRSHAGFVPPRSALVRTDTGIRLEARPKYNFLNPFRLPERNSLIVGVQPGYGIRDDNFDIHGNPVPPMPPPPPGMFGNAAAIYRNTCPAGSLAGPSVEVDYMADVFISSISQADADDMVRYAFYTGRCDGSGNIPPVPGVCCSTVLTRLKDLIWTVGVGASSGPVESPDEATFTWSDVLATGTFHLKNLHNWLATNPLNGLARVDWCNPWPSYDIIIQFDYTVGFPAGGTAAVINNRQDGDIEQFLWSSVSPPGSTIITPNGSNVIISHYLAPVSSSGTLAFGSVATIIGGNSLFLQVVSEGAAFGTVGSGNSIDINVMVTPLTPPTTGDTQVTVSAIPVPFHYDDRPANDDFADAVTLAASGTLNSTNLYASLEVNEPNGANGHPTTCATIWYKWVAPSTAAITFDTFGSDFDTMLFAYTGVSVDALTEIAFNDDSGPGSQSQITFTPVSGTTYWIRVCGYGNTVGNITLNWS